MVDGFPSSSSPVSIVYYLKPDEVDTYKRLKEKTQLRDNVHLSYMIQHNNSQYPINKLRNKAISYITTSHYYFSDMDNWPSRSPLFLPFLSTSEPLRRTASPAALRSERRQADHHRPCLPDQNVSLRHFPAVRRHVDSLVFCHSRYASYFPKTKRDLHSCILDHRCQTFRPREWLHDYYPRGWFDSKEPLMKLECLRSDTQEPYVVVKRSAMLPAFNESFVTYAYDKIQWLEHLRRLGYYYQVMVEGYSVDVPHPP